jgi:hypothetical protein
VTIKTTTQLEQTALSWAAADRAADDRAADVQGIERSIANSALPVPAALLADRDAAVITLREACKVEGKAEADLREAARQLLDARNKT